MPVPEALIFLRDPDTHATLRVPVSVDGGFNLRFLQPGEYDLTVETFGARPLRIQSVPIGSGTVTHVHAVLMPSAAGTAEPEVREYQGVSGTGTDRVAAAQLRRYPVDGRELTRVTRLVSSSNSLLETEGLPGSSTRLRVNGLPVAVAPTLGVSGPGSLFPLSAFAQVELVDGRADVEWADASTGEWSTQLTGASQQLELRTFGALHNGASVSGRLASPAFTGFEVGALLSGPIDPEVADFVMGMELWRSKHALGFPSRIDSIATRLADAADQQRGRDIGSALPKRLSTTDAVAFFGRMDWRLDAANQLSVHALAASMPDAQLPAAAFPGVTAPVQLKRVDATAGTTLRSQLSDDFANELKLSWDRVGRADDGDLNDIATTTLVRDALRAGRQLQAGAQYVANSIRVSDAVHLWRTHHHVKFGLSGDVGFYDIADGEGTQSRFWLSVPEDLGAADGYVVTATGLRAASFRQMRAGVFLQDEWLPASRFRLLLGLRWDLELPPVDDLRLNSEWFRLSGIRSDLGLSRRGRLSPRAEFEWQPDAARRWSLRGFAGVWTAPSDPAVTAALLSNDGRAEVQRGFQPLDEWPDAPADSTRPGLTLVPTGFQGPRSKRAGVELAGQLAAGLMVEIGGAYRRSELLPRIADLNLATTPSAEDQHERPVFGLLQQRGSMLAPAAGTNRRFREFDQVAAMGVDGWSEYRALNASLQLDVRSTLSVRARYTYSKTEDNWFLAREGVNSAALPPFPSDSLVDWREGVSDFDLPHRAAIGAELSFPLLGGVHLAGLYRYRSGYPFTPGFRAGVDANGDGSFRNDPAFIDGAITGLSELAARSSCVSAQLGRFAARNSCRQPAASSIDGRLTIAFFDSGQHSGELVVDAFNLYQSGGEEVDRALLLVDPAGSLTRDTAAATITIPWVSNPDFGAPQLRSGAARMLRVGLRVTY